MPQVVARALCHKHTHTHTRTDEYLDYMDHVDVPQVVVSPKKHVFMAMEYMDHDFRALMESMKVFSLLIS